jgi:hypothetical protein
MKTWSLRGDADNAGTFLVEGWESYSEGPPGQGYRWSLTRAPRVIIPSPGADQGPGELRLDLLPFTSEPTVREQIVWIFASGLFVAYGRLAEATLLTGVIPPSAWVGSTVSLSFVLPNAHRPSEVGASGDQRLLGVALRSMELVL